MFNIENIYNEDFKIKFGHLQNVKISQVSIKDLKALKKRFTHDKQLLILIEKTINHKSYQQTLAEVNKIKSNKSNSPISETKPKSFLTKTKSALKTIPNNIVEDKDLKKYPISIGFNLTETDFMIEDFYLYYKTKNYKSRDWNNLWKKWVDKNLPGKVVDPQIMKKQNLSPLDEFKKNMQKLYEGELLTIYKNTKVYIENATLILDNPSTNTRRAATKEEEHKFINMLFNDQSKLEKLKIPDIF